MIIKDSMQLQGQRSESPPAKIQDLLQEKLQSRVEFLQTYNDLKKELHVLHKESMQMLQGWINKIYLNQMHTSDIYFTDGIEITVTPEAIEDIIRKTLTEICQSHQAIITQQMELMLEYGVAEYYAKSDEEQKLIGFLDSSVTSQWASENNFMNLEGNPFATHTKHLNVNYYYYEYCVWVIYQHYCSLSTSNKQVCLLIETIRQSSEAQFYHFYREMEEKRMIAELEEAVEMERIRQKNKDFENSTDQEKKLESDKIARLKAKAAEALNYAHRKANYISNSNCDHIFSSYDSDIKNTSLDKMINLIDEYDLVRESELNVLTIINLIPTMPTIDTGVPPMNQFYVFPVQLQKYEELYQHINKFEQTINNIINKGKQNMRKYCLYLEEFKRAIIILRRRLKNMKMNIHKRKILEREQMQYRQFMEEDFQLQEIDPETKKKLNRIKQIEKENERKEELRKKQSRERKNLEEFEKMNKNKSEKETSIESLKCNEQSVSGKSQKGKKVTEKAKVKLESMKFEKKMQITPIFETLFSKYDTGKESKKGEKQRYFSTDIPQLHEIRKKSSATDSRGERRQKITASVTAKSTSKEGNIIFQRLEKKVKMLIERECTNREQLEAIMASFTAQEPSRLQMESRKEVKAQVLLDDEMNLHEFIESNLKVEKDEQLENEFEEMDEDFLERQVEEQKNRKKDKRKRNKMKRKEQMMKKKEKDDMKQNEAEKIDKAETCKRQKGQKSHQRETKQNSSCEETTVEQKVIKWLKELNINDSQREACYPISNSLIKSWQKKLHSQCSDKRNLISLSVSPQKNWRTKRM